MVTSDHQFNRAEDFLDFFIKDNWFRTTDRFAATGTGRASMLFRGQSNATWGLIPSAFRDNDPLHNFTPQPPYFALPENRRILGHHLHAEARAVFLFLESADRLGFPTPIDFATAKDSYELVNAAINDKDYDYSEPFPSKTYESSVALAQHYGVPTRFLDWTESPLVACYFAAYDASVFASEPHPQDQEIAVYFFTNHSTSKKGSPISLVKAPRFQNANLRHQQGVFTNFNAANLYFIEHKQWPDLLELANGDFQIQRRRLPATEADNLLRLLFDLDITRENMVPSLANAALSYQYRKGLFHHN